MRTPRLRAACARQRQAYTLRERGTLRETCVASQLAPPCCCCLQEAVLDKAQFMAQLDADASSEEEEQDAGDAEDEEGGGGGAAAVARAREELARAALERKTAITRAMEREDRKRAEQEARRAVREQAGHTNSSSSKGGGKGRGAGDAKDKDAKRK
jgi:hypothetical protein